RVSPTGRVTLDDGPRILGYRPCADVTLETAADYAGPLSIGVILTGMGNDGARGAQAVKDAGGLVLAQDEATSVIFGMNAEAIRDLTGLQKLSVPAEHQKFTRVTHTLDREGKRHFVIDICAHFGVQSGRASRLMVLRHAPAAVMVDAIERMQEIDSIQALPAA